MKRTMIFVVNPNREDDVFHWIGFKWTKLKKRYDISVWQLKNQKIYSPISNNEYNFQDTQKFLNILYEKGYISKP